VINLQLRGFNVISMNIRAGPLQPSPLK